MDDDLCAAIGVADAEPATFRLDGHQQLAFLAAMAAEAVRRLGGRRAEGGVMYIAGSRHS